ncbi:hypothetical protein BDV10DRAFT_19439 [Aspergillus recurvatus]
MQRWLDDILRTTYSPHNNFRFSLSMNCMESIFDLRHQSGKASHCEAKPHRPQIFFSAPSPCQHYYCFHPDSSSGVDHFTLLLSPIYFSLLYLACRLSLQLLSRFLLFSSLIAVLIGCCFDHIIFPTC